MASQGSYPIATPAAGDKLLGIDISDPTQSVGGSTANFTVSALADTAMVLTDRAPYILFDGDSKAAEPGSGLQFVDAETPLDAIIGGGIGVGGSNSGSSSTTNLTSAARLASAAAIVTSTVATYGAVDIWLTIGTNDLALGTAPETVLANVKTYWTTMKAAGASRLVVMSIDPRSGQTESGQSKIDSINAAYQDWAASRGDVRFVDTQPWWLDPATAHEPIGGSAGAAFAVTNDGLHGSGYGFWRKGLALAAVARSMYRPRGEGILGTGYFDATNPRGNVLNLAGTRGNGGSTTGLGRARAMGGAVGDGFASFTNSGSGSVTGTPPLGWVLGGGINGDMSLTFEVVNSAALAAKYGGVWPVVRMTWSGTPSANGSITLIRAITGGSIASNPVIEAKALAVFNAVNGLMLWWAQGSSSSAGGALGYIGGTSQASSQLPELSGVKLLRGVGRPASLANNANLTQYLYFRAGVPVSGSIEFVAASLRNIAAV